MTTVIGKSHTTQQMMSVNGLFFFPLLLFSSVWFVSRQCDCLLNVIHKLKKGERVREVLSGFLGRYSVQVNIDGFSFSFNLLIFTFSFFVHSVIRFMKMFLWNRVSVIRGYIYVNKIHFLPATYKKEHVVHFQFVKYVVFFFLLKWDWEHTFLHSCIVHTNLVLMVLVKAISRWFLVM